MDKEIKHQRTLSHEEIELINHAKELGNSVGEFIDSIPEKLSCDDSESARWRAIAKTDLQKGFMSLLRSIAKPYQF
jgi:hypothetical protein